MYSVAMDSVSYFLLMLAPNNRSVKTVSFMYTFFGAMVLYPDVQHRAQSELDTVLGQDRLPTFDDRPSLPFIDAVVLEVFRWNVILPLGMMSFFQIFVLSRSQTPRPSSHGYRGGRISRLPDSKRIDRGWKHVVCGAVCIAFDIV